MRNPRENGFREIRDPTNGKFIVRVNPHTGEVQRPDGGRILRGNLTDAGQSGYTPDRKSQGG